MTEKTRLLVRPSIAKTHIAYAHGSDIWATNLETMLTTRFDLIINFNNSIKNSKKTNKLTFKKTTKSE